MPYSHQLHSIYLNLTTACNLRCRHCFIEAGRPENKELNASEIINILDTAAQLHVEKLTITGGEPLMRLDFLEIANHASRYVGKEISQLSLVTNAVLVDKAMAKRLANIFSKINVSLDGLEDVNDSIRGKGSFQDTIRGIRCLVNAGIEPVIFITITKINIESIGLLINTLYVQEGLTNFKLRPIWKFGRAEKNPDLLLTEEERAQLGFPSRSMIDMGRPEGDEEGPLGFSLNIHPNGDIYPCHLLRYPEFIAGNLRHQPIADIFLGSTIFSVLRAWGNRCCQQVNDPRSELNNLLDAVQY